jgi:hypothetical protein
MREYTVNAAPRDWENSCRLGAALPRENAPTSTLINTYSKEGMIRV